MLLDGHVGEVDEGVVQLVGVARVLGRAEAGEAVGVEVDAERPAAGWQRRSMSVATGEQVEKGVRWSIPRGTTTKNRG